jgi:hypothetical protein
MNAESRDDSRRAEWFARRREELRGERWRQRLRAAKIISPCRHAAANAREGGWVIEFCGTDEDDLA